MESAAGVDGCALAVDKESRVRAATVAIVPEMRFIGASSISFVPER
jgi:hypothetical protein